MSVIYLCFYIFCIIVIFIFCVLCEAYYRQLKWPFGPFAMNKDLIWFGWSVCKMWNSSRTTLLNTAHTVGVHCGASLSAECGYNPGWCRSHPTISEMTYNVSSGTLNHTQPKTAVKQSRGSSLTGSIVNSECLADEWSQPRCQRRHQLSADNYWHWMVVLQTL